MLGWGINVLNVTPEQKETLRSRDVFAPYLLASWEAGMEGLQWIEELVEKGKATKLKSDGYPNRYAAKAVDVLPCIRHRLPGYSEHWVGEKDDIERLRATCHPENTKGYLLEATVTIDAWDLS